MGASSRAVGATIHFWDGSFSWACEAGDRARRESAHRIDKRQQVGQSILAQILNHLCEIGAGFHSSPSPVSVVCNGSESFKRCIGARLLTRKTAS
jgi:hypothetical protein